MFGTKKGKDNFIPILPLKNAVFFPGTVMPLLIGREKSLKLINAVIKTGTDFGVVAQRDVAVEEPIDLDLYKVGTIAKIIKFSKTSDGNYNVIIEGTRRFEYSEMNTSEPFFTADVE